MSSSVRAVQSPCLAQTTCSVPASPAGPGRSLARQPILDREGTVVGYELLFRNSAANAFAGPGDLASQIMVDNTLIYGLSKLTAGLPAFINCTAETLGSDYIRMLPAQQVILEVLENVERTEEVVAACHRLRGAGYKIALDDFVDSPSLDPLIAIADFIKIDFRLTPAAERRSLIARLIQFKGRYIAEKVETLAEYEEARQQGFALFQGYYFCKPALLKKRAVPPNRLVHLRLLTLLQANPLDLVKISAIVKSEPSLAYRLLRYVNSAGNSVRPGITSIKAALLAVGDDLFRRMATLAVAVELNSGPSPEILRIALVRARFCETAAYLCGLNSTEQYLLGLFSLLDAMLQMTMQEALAPLALPAPIREALLGARNRLRCPLYWLESHERGDFERCDDLATAHGFAPALLDQNFAAATTWADELLAEG